MKNLNLMIDDLILSALKEDMPFGDISTDSLFTGDEMSEAEFISKDEGVVSGLFVAERVFKLLDGDIKFHTYVKEGEKAAKGQVIALVQGKTSSILKGERTALNFLQRMCGISTKTARLADLLKDTNVRIADTRKTVPGLRMLDKYAVKAGGGSNHRFSLSDAVMLKDNHIKATGGIKKAIDTVRRRIPHTMKIEVEAETITQVKEAVDAKADIIMLDNMSVEDIKESVKIINKRALVEISGNIDESNILIKAVEGVDIISSGSLTHSVKAMDISLKFK